MRPDTVYVWKGGDGWRWTRVDAYNGKRVGGSGEGYENRSHAENMARKYNPGCELVFDKVPTAVYDQ